MTKWRRNNVRVAWTFAFDLRSIGARPLCYPQGNDLTKLCLKEKVCGYRLLERRIFQNNSFVFLSIRVDKENFALFVKIFSYQII